MLSFLLLLFKLSTLKTDHGKLHLDEILSSSWYLEIHVVVEKKLNLCNYQGHVEGFPNSVVTISTCSGLRGLIQFENISYGIEPLETAVRFAHMIYPIKSKNASYSLYAKMDNEKRQLSHKIPRIKYEYLGSDAAVVTQKVFQVIELTSTMFTSFNITLVLSSLELWIDNNKIPVTGDANELLYRFLNWKSTYLVLRPYDVTFLLVYRDKSNYAGATLKGKMCDKKSAGGVALYSTTISLEAFAVIIAQLLGLSMGIAFDDINKCHCSGAACVMSPEAIHSSGVKIFSNCSIEDFIHFISKPVSQCLQNKPHLEPSYKTSSCGNKLVEDGEQCDCGHLEFRAKGEICRLSEDECDLTEYCNGSSNFCPKNFYLHDGYRCNMNQWVCMKGKCWDGTRICEEIYGQGTLYGSQACFEEINSRNDQFGNCGLSLRGFVPCTLSNLRCGKLVCIYRSKFPFSKENAEVLYTRVKGDLCVSLYFPDRNTTDRHMWVPSGTICGNNKICIENMCVDDNLLPKECTNEKCNHKGGPDSADWRHPFLVPGPLNTFKRPYLDVGTLLHAVKKPSQAFLWKSWPCCLEVLPLQTGGPTRNAQKSHPCHLEVLDPPSGGPGTTVWKPQTQRLDEDLLPPL
ncbi:PREDICTED: disintegrin and metalloproteinase domain-containing protein 2-like [Elephantulus edwardii]|uniref:disintegrin and metalloproteinase domain-containing protein 2-like n=1 Tax=Elephantulus edwardii TaxID=28737 RepID=UPI0003F05974|nr:PREDICTED: disintegrin and metalloproteinase domain-containing protein 2-like [Elephantulus edwardii]